MDSPMIDNRTIFLEAAILNTLFTVVLILIWRMGRASAFLGKWVMGAALIAIATWLVGLRDAIPNLLSISLGNLCFFLGILMYSEGFREFHSQRWRTDWLWVMLIPQTAAVFYFWRMDDDFRVRVFLWACFTALIMGYFGLRLAIPVLRGGTLGSKVAFLCTCILALVNLLMPLDVSVHPTASDLLDASTLTKVIFLVDLVLIICLPTSLMLAYYERLMAERARETEERHAMEIRLAQAERMESVGRLAGGIAHNVNNDMTVVQGYCELLLMNAGPADPARVKLEAINRAAGKTVDLTAKLMAFARSHIMRAADIDLPSWLETNLPVIRKQAGEAVVVRVQVKSGPLAVRIDGALLSRTLLGMADNSRDAMPLGGVLTLAASRIGITQESAASLEPEPGPYVRLSVSDTGAGMDEATRKRIFEPFFTTKGLAVASGMSLPSALGILVQSGGTITVESSPGKGSTFHLFLRAADQQA